MGLAPALGLTLASGGLYGLTFPTASWQLAAWVALAPWLLALRGASVRRALALGWIWTVTAASTLGDWFPGAVASYYHQPLWIGVALFFGVSTLLAAPYYMLFAVWYRTVARRSGPWLPVLTAAAWVAAEIARARFVGGNPWALFGYSQVGRDALVQIADATGVYGVAFLLVAVNAALVEWLAAPRGRGRAAAARATAGVAGLVAAALVYGWVRMATLTPAPAGPIAVGLVQGNLDVGTQWSEEHYGKNLDAYLRLTGDVLRLHRPALVIWPENALTFFLETEAIYRAAIAHVLAASGAQLLAGGPSTAAEPGGRRYFNSMFLLDAAGAILARYDKQRLVPLGERFPLPSFAALARRFERVRELSPGPHADPIATRAGLAGITICSEAMFPEIAAARVRAGASFFVDPAHDTWLTPKFSAQQFDIVRLRTVEQRRWLARASTSGPSAIVDPLGRVVLRSDYFTRTALAGRIEPRDDVTPYRRVGDLFAIACVVVAAAAALVRVRR